MRASTDHRRQVRNFMRRVRSFAGALLHELREDRVTTYAAALAYHALLAVFPFALFLIAVVTFLDVQPVFVQLMKWAASVLPPTAFRQITDVIRQFQQTDDAGLLSLGMAGAIWAASGGVRATIDALNTVYDVQERRSFGRLYLVSIGFTLALGVLILLSSVLLLVGPKAFGWVARQFGWSDGFAAIWAWLRYPAAAVLLVMVTGIVYSTFPNLKGFRLITPGSFVTVPLWILLSFGFQLYLSHFGRFNLLYGSVAAVIVLLIYFWLSAIVLLLGGELNALIAARTHRSRAGRPAASAREKASRSHDVMFRVRSHES
jgi:membrane protein